MQLVRWLRHAFSTRYATRRRFPASALDAIERAIRDAERRHSGEILLAIETSLEGRHLRRGVSPRERAVEVFGRLRVWDTELNNGVLIYVLLADRDVEIVADRGFNGRISAAEWEQVCREMERHFAGKAFEAGVIAGIGQVGALIARHFPGGGDDRNQLPDRPQVL